RLPTGGRRMPELVYVYSTSADDGSAEAIHKVWAARAQETGGREVGVASAADFATQLGKLRDEGVKIDRLGVETPGSPGTMWFGNDAVTATALAGYKGQGFEDLFAPDAHVFLQGCNAAAEQLGRDFLLALGLTFLRKGGGRVGGCTGLARYYHHLTNK